jgi:nucleotide-binding universal stress UspA family protein
MDEILCPVDFSEFSKRAVDHALVLARWYDSAVTLLHVQPIVVPLPLAPEIPPTLILTPEYRAQLTESLQKLAGDAQGVRMRYELREGTAAREICEAATEIGADLLVIGTHGASGFEHLLLGSVTERVLRKADCPVLTVPRAAPGALHEPPFFKRILCATDFSDCSRRALEYALSLAQEADGCLTVAHVFELEGSLPENWREKLTPPSVRRALIDLEHERIEQLARAVPADANTYCTVDTVMGRGTPYKEILRLAAEKRVDLIVMGLHGRNAADVLFFGSTTNQVVRQASCPVLTIRRN